MEFQMEYPVHNLGVNKGMERSRCSSAKEERKIIEKNRRNHMKNLYSRLNSLLPHHNSKEPLSLPDQIDEAVNYIQNLETSLKVSREKKDSLMGRKRSYRCTNTASLKSPEIRISEKGSAIEVALITGQESQLMFYEMIRILHVEGAEVLNASFSTVGNTIFHIVHAEIGALEAAKIITEKLNKFAHGSTSDEELRRELCDNEIDPETWGFPIM
ncbi:transcription factor bHLH162-like [Durio zibethinus]|uniref:Transcription factor bHLH162-like n=1 Tax=Durio zibethinus TaxID=66656 RepID=A0A6P5Z837_DURZI|nr:transcription factor bHLH162-like [Durio zibethinus]